MPATKLPPPPETRSAEGFVPYGPRKYEGVERLDYQYDARDYARVKTAYEQLVEDDQTGFKVGISTWAAGWIIGKSFFPNKRAGIRNALSLFAGILAYNIYTHESKTIYSKIADHVNTKITKDINRVMKFTPPPSV